MFDLLPTEGRINSLKRRQINRLNAVLKKINQYENTNPQGLQRYLDKLISFHQKTIQKGSADKVIKDWFTAHPLFRTQQQIGQILNSKQIQLDIRQLVEKIDMKSIYRNYEGKDSFKTLIENKFTDFNPQCKVESLGGGNNPAVKVTLNDAHPFVVRFLRVDSNEEKEGLSPRVARERVAHMRQIAQPYLLTWIEDDFQETTYLEFSAYYEHGNLEEQFDRLHRQCQRNKKTPPGTLNPLVLSYARQFLEFFLELNKQGIWYTDLKPSNVLLNSDGSIVISDIKGLVTAEEKTVSSFRASTSRAYYQSTVYEGRAINLERLQQQTLANTLYELACNKLPIPKVTHQPHWKNKYDFDLPYFHSAEGQLIKSMIQELNKSQPQPLNKFLTMIDTFNKEQEQSHQQKAGRLFSRKFG
ncbi:MULTISPECIES: protein kinase family protein [unclassified Legionella]|uniref:protein kinase domain-containing protein n=1 Tax=unclassified Legionella TaxID=2622702 RepID=UPI001054DDF0|nr:MULTISPECIES: protein kinase family protein [unclassified Legionella]MDI9817811.1 protein kinase family protein [Legionella sp. PL877]